MNDKWENLVNFASGFLMVAIGICIIGMVIILLSMCL